MLALLYPEPKREIARECTPAQLWKGVPNRMGLPEAGVTVMPQA